MKNRQSVTQTPCPYTPLFAIRLNIVPLTKCFWVRLTDKGDLSRFALATRHPLFIPLPSTARHDCTLKRFIGRGLESALSLSRLRAAAGRQYQRRVHSSAIHSSSKPPGHCGRTPPATRAPAGTRPCPSTAPRARRPRRTTPRTSGSLVSRVADGVRTFSRRPDLPRRLCYVLSE